RYPQSAPSFTFLQSFFVEEISRACRSHWFAGCVKNGDCENLAGFDELIGAAIHQFIEHGLEALRRNSAAESKAANEGHYSLGNILATVPYVGFVRFTDADVLFNLPADDERPNARQKAINQQVAARHYHESSLFLLSLDFGQGLPGAGSDACGI